METFLDCGRVRDEPEQPPEAGRSWILSCRNVTVAADGTRTIGDTFLHNIEEPNLAAAERAMQKFLKDKQITDEEW